MVHKHNFYSPDCFTSVLFLGFHKVMEGIDKALETGFNPVKVSDGLLMIEIMKLQKLVKFL